MSTQTTRRTGGDPAPPEEPSLAARLPEILARAAWVHRWRLAPAYLGVCTAIGAGTGHGLTMATGLGTAAAAAEVAARTGVSAPDGRMLLTVGERHLAAIGLAGTGGWAVLVGTFGGLGLPWLAEAGLLAGVLAWPAHRWVAGRGPQPEPEPEPSLYSLMAQRFFDGWTSEITVGEGPRMMRGSVPVVDTLIEPAAGALTVEMQLAKGVAAKNVVSEANRRQVEALFKLPEDTVRLETVRDDSTRIRVMITASRHLEVEGGLDWPGPVLMENGDVPLAVTGDGSLIAVPLFRKDGVRHGMISGTTGVGKSVSSVSVLLPGVIAGYEVVLYLDGKRGTSAPYLRPIIARYARMDQQWPILIEIAHRILKARENRRGALGLDTFDVLTEDDPIITVFIDEPNAVNHSAFFKTKHVRMVLEILEHGRALGVRLIQCGQSPAGEDLIGGVQARGLMSGGWSINHRAGGKGASRLTLDSTNASVSLLELPEGGAAITVGGKLVGFPAQVRNATKDRVGEEIQGFTPRVADWLAGDDLAAAGPEWAAAHWEDSFKPGYIFDAATPAAVPRPLAGMEGEYYTPSLGAAWVLSFLQERGPMTAAQLAEILPNVAAVLEQVLEELIAHELVIRAGDQYALTPNVAGYEESQAYLAAPSAAMDEQDDLPASRMWVLEQLTDHPDGLTLKQLEALPGHPSRRTISNALLDLGNHAKATRDGAVWFAVIPREAVDDPTDNDPTD